MTTINRIHNNMCDGDKCQSENGQVRVLPTGSSSNAILCLHCFTNELNYRAHANRTLGDFAKFSLPKWTDLQEYVA